MSSPSTMETETARPVFSTDVSAECAAPSDDATLLASSAVQRAMDGAASRRTHDEWRARMIAARGTQPTRGIESTSVPVHGVYGYA